MINRAKQIENRLRRLEARLKAEWLRRKIARKEG